MGMTEKFEMIKQIMEELQAEMEPGADELGERLGRPKPAIEMEIEGVPDMDGDVEGMEMELGEVGPEDELKKRLMKIRG